MTATRPARIVLDGTPLLGPRTGIGRYTAQLLAGLAALPDSAGRDLAATAFTWRGLEDLPAALPPGVRVAARRAPARLLQEMWAHSDTPPVEWLTGPADIFHATNFVLPPLRHARGVLNIHDLSYLRVPGTVTAATARYADLVPRGLRRADAVLTLSNAVTEEIIDTYHLDPARVTVTPCGVDDEWFTAVPPDPALLASLGLPERYLVFVGSTEPRKNLATLLEALRRLRAERPDTPPLVLIGPPGWGPALDLASLPPEAVIITGFLPDDVLRRVVAGAAASCFPSLYEGFGLPPLEAMAAGTPVVASDIGAVRELAGPVAGAAVRLVPAVDPDAYVDALIGVLDHPPDMKAAREHARTFTWERTARITARVYDSLL